MEYLEDSGSEIVDLISKKYFKYIASLINYMYHFGI
jgi:hypothetical protein